MDNAYQQKNSFMGNVGSPLNTIAHEIIHWKHIKHFDEPPTQDAEPIRYGAADSDFALRLYRIFNEWFDSYLPRHRWIVENIESPMAVYLGIMKANDVPIDHTLMEQRKAEADAEKERIKREIGFLIGDVNIGANCSTSDFKKYLFESQGLPILKATNKSHAALDDMTMVLLSEWCEEHKPERKRHKNCQKLSMLH